ncbi:MAG TPA: nuclear transport factor 2 family protein [Sphingomicrobium sp.]|jgi:ketosteroid isomerase-like protein
MNIAHDPQTAVRNYLNAFNHGDAPGMASCFASPGFILDGMAPHVWDGPSAPLDWYQDVLSEGEHAGASGYAVSIGEPAHNATTGDRGYFVAPATMTFSVRGQEVRQVDATFTVALTRKNDSWLIAAWAWSKGRPAQ